jgi:hypothetical protein
MYSGQDDRIEDYDPDNVPISYDDLLQFYKQRRTCRWFKDEKISHETIEKLMEAAYYSPNRQNIQDVEFALVEDQMDEFIDHVYNIIKVKQDEFFRIKQVGDYLADELFGKHFDSQRWSTTSSDERRIMDRLINKIPVDGLQPQTDEERLGFTYADLDKFIRLNEGSDEFKALIRKKFKQNKFKLEIVQMPQPDFSYLPNFVRTQA